MRVAAGVDFAEGVDVDVGVDLGGFEAGVAEHFLDVADVGSAPVHVGGAGVAEEVAGAGLLDAAALHGFLDPVAEVGGGEAGAVAAEEQRGFPGKVGEVRAGIPRMPVEPCGGAVADGKHAAFAAFAAADVEGFRVRVVIAMVEVGQFGAADAGGVEEFEDGAVAQAEGIGGVGNGEQKTDFLRAESLRELACLFAWKVEIGGGVRGDDSGAAEPSEESAQATEPRELRVDGEGAPSARAAVAVQEELVGFEIGALVGGGIVGAARGRPFGELPQRPAVGFDGGRRVMAGGEGFEKRIRMGGHALRYGGLRGGCAAFAASAHGGEVGESGLSWHDGRVEWRRSDAMGRRLRNPLVRQGLQESQEIFTLFFLPLAARFPNESRMVICHFICLPMSLPQVGRRLAAGWPQVGRRLAAGWPQVGRRLADTLRHGIFSRPLQGRFLTPCGSAPGFSFSPPRALRCVSLTPDP